VETLDGRGRVDSPSFHAAWPWIATALSKFPEFDHNLAIAEVRRESADARLALLAVTSGDEVDENNSGDEAGDVETLIRVAPFVKDDPNMARLIVKMLARLALPPEQQKLRTAKAMMEEIDGADGYNAMKKAWQRVRTEAGVLMRKS
jgi:hypothetical protein